MRIKARELPNYVNKLVRIDQCGYILVEKVNVYPEVVYLYTHYVGYREQQLIVLQPEEGIDYEARVQKT